MPTDSSAEHVPDTSRLPENTAVPDGDDGVTNSAETLARTREQYRANGPPNAQAHAVCDDCFNRTTLTAINTNAHNACNIALEAFFALVRYRGETNEKLERIHALLFDFIRRFFGGGSDGGSGDGGDNGHAGSFARIEARVDRVSEQQDDVAETLHSICNKTRTVEDQLNSVVEILRTLAQTVGNLIQGRALDMQLVGAVAETVNRVAEGVARVDARIAQLSTQADERLSGIAERVKTIEDASSRFVVRVGAERPRGARVPRPPTPVPAVPRVPVMTANVVAPGPRGSVSSINTQLPEYTP